jgi:hypothetical protein
VVAIDSDVFIIDRRYSRDGRYAANRLFLDRVREAAPPHVTTILNVFEVCGVLSFNLGTAALQTLHEGFGAKYGVVILQPVVGWRVGIRVVNRLLERTWVFIARKMAFRDAFVISTLEQHPAVGMLVTWNARHFVGKTRLNVVTPEEYLAAHGQPTS